MQIHTVVVITKQPAIIYLPTLVMAPSPDCSGATTADTFLDGGHKDFHAEMPVVSQQGRPSTI